MRNTNKRLYDLLNYINECQQTNYYNPSIREMCEKCGVSSTCTIAYYIKKLINLGLLSKEDLKSRALTILKPKEEWNTILNIKDNEFSPETYTTNLKSNSNEQRTICVPLIGKVTAGIPIWAHEEFEDCYELPYSLFNKNDLFMLNVKGESMINAGIFNGDQVVVEKQSTAENGEIVVALVDDSATIKRFYKENNQFMLKPENDTMKPIYCNDVQILGKVVGLIRKM